MGISNFFNFKDYAYNVDKSIESTPGSLGTPQKDVISETNFANESESVGDQSLNEAYTEVGYTADGESLPTEYLVRVTSARARTIVRGAIQSGFNLVTESIWENFIPTELSSVGDELLQTLSQGKWALVTKATSRRKWKGSTPVRISIPLKFDAIKSAAKDVVAPCRVLQGLALPSEGESAQSIKSFKDLRKGIPLLSPPGPTPFTLEDILSMDQNGVQKFKKDAVQQGKRGGDHITVAVGRFLTFENVILKSVQVEYHPRMDSLGNPIAANVQLVFETYEIMTVEGLDRSYRKRTTSENE